LKPFARNGAPSDLADVVKEEHLLIRSFKGTASKARTMRPRCVTVDAPS